MTENRKDETPVEKLSFEDALRELEKIVNSLEKGELSLDAAVSAYERGTILKIACQSRLEEARMRVESIKVPNAGNPPSETKLLDDEA